MQNKPRSHVEAGKLADLFLVFSATLKHDQSVYFIRFPSLNVPEMKLHF